MKVYIKKFLISIILISSIIVVMKAPIAVQAESLSNFSSYIIATKDNDNILERYNENKKVQIASITKLMTAYIVLQDLHNGKIKLSDSIYPSKYACSVEPSKAYIRQNYKYTLKDIFTAMLVRSANDCAIAISETICDSEAQFVNRMNITAENLKMSNTHYCNSTGLGLPSEYSTALDQYKLAKIVFDDNIINEILNKKSFSFKNGDTFDTVYTTNKLLKNGIIGKTGFTNEAGNCFCGYKEQDGIKAFVLAFGFDDSISRFNFIKGKFDMLKKDYYSKKIISATDNYFIKVNCGDKSEVRLTPAQDFAYTIKRNSSNDNIKIKVKYYHKNMPINKGDICGKIQIINNCKIIKEIDMISAEKCSRIGLIGAMQKIVKHFNLLEINELI